MRTLSTLAVNDFDGFDAFNGVFKYQARSDWLYHVIFTVNKRFKAGIRYIAFVPFCSLDKSMLADENQSLSAN